MLPYRRAAEFVGLVLLTSLTACASSGNLEERFAPDPRLLNNTIDVAGINRQNDENVQLPTDFPAEIPRYPNAQLKDVTQSTPPTGEPGNKENAGVLTLWSSSAPSDSVINFYQQEFQANNWELSPTNESTLAARRNNLQVIVSIQPGASSTTSTTPSPNQSAENPQVATEFVIQYLRNSPEVQPTPAQVIPPQPGEESSYGPPLPDQPTPSPVTPNPNPPVVANELQVFTDINKAPQELRQHIEDLAALGVLALEPTGSNNRSDTTTFEPSKIISRRNYARWLVAANNKIHVNSPAQQIRSASETTQPAFQDVPRSHPDFPIIQGFRNSLVSS